jgi:hypothetical protein
MFKLLPGKRFSALMFVAALCASVPLARADEDLCVAAHERAQVARLSGQLLLSRENARQCAQATCHALIQADCARWLAEINAELPSVTFSAHSVYGDSVADVRVYIRGVLVARQGDMREVPLDPGRYEVRFEAAGFAPVVVSLTLHRAEARHVVQAVLTPLVDPGGLARQAGAQASTGPAPVAAPATARRRRLYIASGAMGGVAAASLATYQLLRWRAHVAADAGEDAHLGRLKHAGWGVAGLGTAAALTSAITLSFGLWGIKEAGVAYSADANLARAWMGIHGNY